MHSRLRLRYSIGPPCHPSVNLHQHTLGIEAEASGLADIAVTVSGSAVLFEQISIENWLCTSGTEGV